MNNIQIVPCPQRGNFWMSTPVCPTCGEKTERMEGQTWECYRHPYKGEVIRTFDKYGQPGCKRIIAPTEGQKEK